MGYPGIDVSTFNGKTALIVNVPVASFKGRYHAGITAVIYTYPGIASSGVFNLSTLNGTNGCILGGNAFDRAGFALTPINLGKSNMGLFLGAPGMIVNGVPEAGGGYYVSAICQNATMDLHASLGNNVARFSGSAVSNGYSGISAAAGYYNNDDIQDLAIGGTDKVDIIYGEASPVITTNIIINIRQNSTVRVGVINATFNGQFDPTITLTFTQSNNAFFSLINNLSKRITNCTVGQGNQLFFTTNESRTPPSCTIFAVKTTNVFALPSPQPCIVNFTLLPPYLVNNTVVGYIGQPFPVTTDNIGPEERGGR